MRPTRSAVLVRPRPAVTGVLLALLVALLGVMLAPMPPASAGNIDHQVADASDDLAASSKAVVKAAADLQSAQALLPAAQAQVAKAQAAMRAAQAAAAVAATASAAAVATSLLAQQHVVEAEARIVDMNGQIGDLARAVYSQGPYAELATILDSSSPADFADRLQAIRSVSRSQNKSLSDLQVAKADLALASMRAQQASDDAATKVKAAKDALATAASAAAAAASAKARVEMIVSQRRLALAIASKEKAKVAAQYAALKTEQARLRELERREANSFTGIPTGSLAWPIPGAAVVQGVGPRIHPVYGYASCHTGDDVHAGYGTPIHAAAAGKVIAVDNGGAYGLHTTIAHGGSVSTMYAHQSSVSVAVGQIVSQGQVIGHVGSSGWVTGPHLHFEVHVNGVPYNPLGWFGGARVPVSCWNG